MTNNFTFGLENEFMLLDKDTYAPKSVHELDFFKLREIILGILVRIIDKNLAESYKNHFKTLWNSSENS